MSWPVADPYGIDAEFTAAEPAGAAADYDRFTAELPDVDAAVANAPLEATFAHRDETLNLRFIYLHLIEEYARHNGHADLLRERIDGATGE